MTKDEALKLAMEAMEITGGFDVEINAIKEALAQPEQKPVAMKFKIYKPTVPDPMRQGINNALLPWVYDQDRSSGFDATMWVTPVATLPPQRKPLTDEEIESMWPLRPTDEIVAFARAIEQAHGIKGLA